MRRLVLKFGGSSVGDVEKIKHAAKIVMEHAQSTEVIVVVSAMQGETNRLLELAKKTYNPLVPNREFDQVLATGEIISASLMALALEAIGLKSISLTGNQAGIHTDDIYQDASIKSVDGSKIKSLIEQGVIPVITGFQGVCDDNITTLGRGGSDLTAVALAHELNADQCWIYTDVQGVYATDPNIVANNDIFHQMGYVTLKKMALAGAEVIQYAAIEYAENNQVSVRICSTFEPGLGTLVISDEAISKPIIVKYSGLTKLFHNAKTKQAYIKLFKNKIVYSSDDCYLLSMVLPEIKTKLRLIQHLDIDESIQANQTLISIFTPNTMFKKTLLVYFESITYVEILSTKKSDFVVRILVPDYKMKAMVSDLHYFCRDLSKEAVAL